MELKFFLNENLKKTADNQPDWRGKVEINGVAHKVAGWNKTTQYGKSIACTLSVDNYVKGQGEIPF
jgi:hypothetical protein